VIYRLIGAFSHQRFQDSFFVFEGVFFVFVTFCEEKLQKQKKRPETPLSAQKHKKTILKTLMTESADEPINHQKVII
jgi:hypothetical protein